VVYYCFGRAGITGSASARTLIFFNNNNNNNNIKVEQTQFWRFSTSSGQRVTTDPGVSVVFKGGDEGIFSQCNRCWRTRGGGPKRLGNRPRGIPTVRHGG
jgi:hypothetical protein